MTKKKLTWRLGKLPTPEEVRGLVQDKLLTQEEAREILFKEESDEERDKKSFESEIQFLRELVERLSKDRIQVIEKIREVQIPYVRYPWYQPYQTWCGSVNGASNTLYSSGTTSLSTQTNTSAMQSLGNTLGSTASNFNFSTIKTF